MERLSKLGLRIGVLAVIIYFVTLVVDGIQVYPSGESDADKVITYLWVALLFALVNTVLGPVLRLLSLPVILLTLGLFLVVINAALLGITAKLSSHLDVDGFWAAAWGGLLIAVFSTLAEAVLPLRKK
jgi:putative membrane protein